MKQIIKRTIEFQEQLEYLTKIHTELCDYIANNTDYKLPDALNRIGDALAEARVSGHNFDGWVGEKLFKAANG